MRNNRQRFHPQSPVQLDRRSAIPFVFLAILLIFMVWKLRDTWIDALATPAGQHDAASDTLAGKRVNARGNLAGLFSADDYPADALRKEEQGRTSVRLAIDPVGRVSNCTVVSSSGSSSLDRATCSILSRRAHFTPARDSNGKRIEDSYTQTIVWELR